MGDRKTGFTLVEMLVVITIIGVLMAMLIPAVGAARASARNTQCQNNLRNIAQAMLQHTTSKDRFPRLLDSVGGKGTNWVTDVMKVVRGDVYEEWLTHANGVNSVRGIEVDVLLCPADVRASGAGGELNYCYNAGRPDDPADYAANGIGHTKASGVNLTLDYVAKHDGTSLTILVGEALEATGWWVIDNTAEANIAINWDPLNPIEINRPPAGPVNQLRPSSAHSGGVNFAFCDGSVRFINETIDYDVYARLMAPYDKGVKSPDSGNFDIPTGWNWSPLSESDFD